MAQINNIKSTIQIKEESLTKRESNIDEKMKLIQKKEEELTKKENELNKKEQELLEREQNNDNILQADDFNPIPPHPKNDDNNNHSLPTKKTLKYGIEIPYLGLGTSRIFYPVDYVYISIKNGLRLIDTAFKCRNEKEVGKGIKKALDEGLCKREDLFIIGKIWLSERKDPEKAIKDTLKLLQLKYLDLYLDHWPSGNIYEINNDVTYQQSIFDVWSKMESLVEKGLTRGIGCSNYNVQSLLNLLSFCKIKPVVNEVELHPYYYQKNLKKFCDKENIALIAYYPLAHGNGAKEYIKVTGKMDSFQEQNILKLSEKYKKSPAQIILNWEISQGIISIPGISQANTDEAIIKERIKENLETFDFKMDNEDIKLLNSIGKKKKFCDCIRFFGINIMA